MAEKRIRRTFSPAFKARAVCELLKGDRTVAQVASDLTVHPNLLTKWKQTAMEKMPTLFTDEGQHVVAALEPTSPPISPIIGHGQRTAAAYLSNRDDPMPRATSNQTTPDALGRIFCGRQVKAK